MTCTMCGATGGPFATKSRCMNCQRQIWRDKHAARMADPDRAARRTANLAAYHTSHRGRKAASRTRLEMKQHRDGRRPR